MPKSAIDRFTSSHATDAAGCWVWNRGRTSTGYGVFYPLGKAPMLAHRFSYSAHNGPIPDGLIVCHKCDVRACVNPAHLFLGTHKDNMQDSLRKGGYDRHRKGEQNHSKLKDDDVIAMRDMAAHGWRASELGSMFGLSDVQAWMIINRRKWKHI